MKKNKTIDQIIKNIIRFGPRQGRILKDVCLYLLEELDKCSIPYSIKTFEVDLPTWGKSYLKADGKRIDCLPTGLVSGKINGAQGLISSIVSSKYFFDVPHINFNPCSKSISRANFSSAPSLAIARNSLSALMQAKKIEGKIQVQKKKEKTYQILVGNRNNPKNIIFTHFDSIGVGAVDNASGTALVLDLIQREGLYLNENLFVFDGNEEISFDRPHYWGKGYRNFEKKFPALMERANRLIVVDCIGYSPVEVLQKDPIVKLAFPIKNIEKYANKILLITGDFDALMSVYHSAEDNGKNIKPAFLEQAQLKLKEILK